MNYERGSSFSHLGRLETVRMLVHFLAILQSCETLVSAYSRLSARPSAWNMSAPATTVTGISNVPSSVH